MTNDDNEEKSTCETYLPPTLAVAGAVSGAFEGFVVGGPIFGSIPSATFQAVGGYHIGQWICDQLIDGELQRQAPRLAPAMR